MTAISSSTMPSTIIEHMGWVQLHSAWQFAAIPALIFAGTWLLRQASSRARYMLLLIGLLLATVAPVVRWFILPRAIANTPVAEIDASTSVWLNESLQPNVGAMQPVPTTKDSTLASPEIAELTAASTTASIENAFTAKGHERHADLLQPWLVKIVVLWCGGVLLFSVRPVFGWLSVRRLRSVGTSSVAENIQEALQRIAQRLHVNRRVEIFLSKFVTSPIVVECLCSENPGSQFNCRCPCHPFRMTGTWKQ